MTNPLLMIVGCGDLGTRLGLQMADLNWQVYGARRSSKQLAQPILPVTIDLLCPTLPQEWPDSTIDYLVFCVAPDKAGDQNYQSIYCQGLIHLLSWLKQKGQAPKQLLIISSTAVYGQNDGQWLDERSATAPSSPQGNIMLEMEQIAKDSGFDYCIVRLAGLYGPNRNYLINQAKKGVHYPPNPPLYANRIHIEDASQLIKQLLIRHQKEGQQLAPCYIGVDDTPAPIQETLTWLRDQLAIKQLATDYAVRTTGSKRLSNQQAKATGWKPLYPSYTEGYKSLLTEPNIL